jgi:capsular exopolysaccharide synthesis family protein
LPVKPNRKLIVLVGLILGLVLGIVQALLRNFFDNTIKRNEDIERLTDIPLYGTLPIVKEPSRMPAYIEAVRSLWVNLAFIRSTRKSKMIAVTSNISGEGKTFTIYHLSRMIAKSSAHRVIVLDMDMRRSTLHEKFHISNTHQGVSTVLSGAYRAEEAIVHTSYENLDVMLSGPKAPNPTRLIISDAFESLIETLSQTYDYILIDTPPIGIVSDAMKIMHASDLVLFMVKAEYSKKEFIQTINRMNEHEEINLGIVLNGVDYTKTYYYYGYKHNYMDNYYQQLEEEKS